MDEKLMPFVKRPEKVSTSIMAALKSAVLEWFLIVLLFIDASFGYLVTKFARYCNLQSPCLLCSRLDHILGNEKIGFYWDLICEKHKSKISSLVLCHRHSSLVDVHGMCESCLFSFATINKSNTEMYRLLVGKLGADALLGLEHDRLLDGDVNGSKICSCCNEQWISQGYCTKLFRSKSIESEGVEMDGDDLKMVRDETYWIGKRVELDSPLSVTIEQDVDDFKMVRDDTYRVSKGVELDVPLSASVGGDCVDQEIAFRVGKINGLDASFSTAVGLEGDDLKMVRADAYRASKGVELDVPLLVSVGGDFDDQEMIIEDGFQVGKSNGFDASLSTAVGLEGLEEDDLRMVRDEIYRVEKGNELDAPLSVTDGDDPGLDSPISATIEHNKNDLKMVRDETYRVEKGNELDAPSLSVITDGDDPEMIRDDAYQVVKEVELDSPFLATVEHNDNDLKMVRDETYRVGNGDEVEVDTPLSVAVGHDGDDGDVPEIKGPEQEGDDVGVVMVRDETYRAGKVSPSSMSNFDPLPHVEYTKVKISSDSESEAHISDDESASLRLHEEYTKKHFLAQNSIIPEPPIITSFTDDTVLEKLINPTSVSESSPPSPDVKSEVADTHYPTAASAPAPAPVELQDGFEELQWQQFEQTTHVSALPELISFDEVYVPGGDSLDVREEAEEEVEDVKELGDSKIVLETNLTTEVQLYSKPDTGETSFQLPNSLELGDAYRLALGSRGRQLSGKFLEQTSLKESTRPSEDFKLLLSQISASMSPRVGTNIDDGSSSMGLKILQKRISLERNESGISLDGSAVSELEGESVVDRLKRQVEQDKRLMNVLYQELEDERNASAVAVNQAMAMITRLQEEKAALQMEALQCLRMMEDQAEYDVEALQNANELVADKEKEIQELRAKLQLYQKRFGDTVEPLSEPEDIDE